MTASQSSVWLQLLSSRSRIWLSRILALVFIATIAVSESAWEDATIKNLIIAFGFILVGFGVIGRVWAGSYICGLKNTQLVSKGPYSITRNPLYFFSFVGTLGIMMMTATVTLPIAFAVIFSLYYISVIKKEERRLLSLHANMFEAYFARVPRFFPKFSLYEEPETYVVTASYYRKFLLEVIWFIFITALVNFIIQHGSFGLVPTYFRLY